MRWDAIGAKKAYGDRVLWGVPAPPQNTTDCWFQWDADHQIQLASLRFEDTGTWEIISIFRTMKNSMWVSKQVYGCINGDLPNTAMVFKYGHPVSTLLVGKCYGIKSKQLIEIEQEGTFVEIKK